MNPERHKQFLLRKERILQAAEKLLLENNQEITLDELVAELDIAKGTLYKHFKSKNELLLELVIQNERQLLKISRAPYRNFREYAPAYMLHHLLAPGRTILLHQLEEHLTMTASGLNTLFEELYQVRQERILAIREVTEQYLKSLNYDMSIRDYLSYIWSLTYGAALLLNSSYYQRSIGSRKKLIQLYINQALSLPSQPINLDAFELDSELL
ncbi:MULTISPECIES: TetR/AcrR family transcriptional regulator [Acinetobacter]|uniref:TetR/AcrR family transcriptional regulator n=1 Tax=Acinetobacter TaxID=469 RepID=UPI002005AC0C|nr:TetR/AcrR family transcriptional regulator [Acinetobacter radioresistens]MCK4081126.1 TetR/AcrR family transcriptional regulator [Acinetobacter radioresistens]MCK4110992.1 TetR/AcrR family transcriptional regulator [Acinetobacter radioresistens]MCU4308150.1 TetR/AcrR family transcriptional regulator [Acinetobacter radioresistens]MCU4384230.1 TetR/AcrR family transcriptional regulator [Acinetobacter radioresistens]